MFPMPGPTSSKYPTHTLFTIGYLINHAQAPFRTIRYEATSPCRRRISSSNNMIGSTTFAEYGLIPRPFSMLPSRAWQRNGHGEWSLFPGVKFRTRAFAQRMAACKYLVLPVIAYRRKYA